MSQSVKIAPSILAADFSRLADEVKAVEAAGADQIHVDVMDGHFVPNLSMGTPVVKSLRRVTDLPLDVHLMVERPERFVELFAEAGASYLTVHIEATPHIHAAIQQIHRAGMKAGVAINPGTPIVALEAIAPDLDIVLVMSVNPGAGGQSFIENSPERVKAVQTLLKQTGSPAVISVDGGLTPDNAGRVISQGATMLVAGSSVFRSADVGAAVRALREAAQGEPTA